MRIVGIVPPLMDLTARQRAHLKGLAHHLKPVVHLGKDGLTDNVVKQIDAALEAHELIKVKVVEGSPLDRHEASDAVPEKVSAFLVQNIGKVLVLYRPHPDNPKIALPWPKEPEAPEASRDVEEARRPTARAPGLLLRSVRDGATVPVVTPPKANIVRPPRASEGQGSGEFPGGVRRESEGRPRTEMRKPAPRAKTKSSKSKTAPRRERAPKRRGAGRRR
jgi:RNA-binding protein